MRQLIWLNGIYPYFTPEIPPDNQILFHNLPTLEQYWRRTPIPEGWESLPEKVKTKFIEQEVDRMFVTGIWFFNKGRKVYLPPDAYFWFNYWVMKDGNFPDFRYSQLREYYFENFAESIYQCIGTFGFKKRRDGRTTRRMCRAIWKAIQPKYSNSWIGMQSKTGADVRDVCWVTMTTGYNSLPIWVKPDQSGSTNPQQKLKFEKPSIRLSRSNVRKAMEQATSEKGLNTIVDMRDTSVDAYDGQEMLDFTGDELAKWEKANAMRMFITYTKCFWRDGKKVGHFHGITSPAQKNGKAHNVAIAFWKLADPAKSLEIFPDGTFKILKKSWFILRFFTGALEGYGGACDKYGDCDRELAKVLIQEEIDNAEPDMKDEIRRQLPMTIEQVLLNEQDMVFSSGPQMNERRIYLLTRNYKDDAETEAKYVYYNLGWKDGMRFTEVVPRASEKQTGFSATGKFCFQELPPVHMRNNIITKRKLKQDIYLPPKDCENIVGIDPYDYRRTESGQSRASEGAAVGGAALDFYSGGYKDKIWFAYQWRTPAPSDFYEDMIKGIWFTSAKGQIESKNKNCIDYFEDNGCLDLLLAKNIKQPNSEHKGNPATTALTDEISALIDDYWADQENLERFWLEMVLEDNLDNFDPANTQKAHLTMALGHWRLGVMKCRLLARQKRGNKRAVLGNEFTKSIKKMYGI